MLSKKYISKIFKILFSNLRNYFDYILVSTNRRYVDHELNDLAKKSINPKHLKNK